MSELRLDAVIAFVEAQKVLDIAAKARRDAVVARRDAEDAMSDAWLALTPEEQAAMNVAYAPGGVTVEAAS